MTRFSSISTNTCWIRAWTDVDAVVGFALTGPPKGLAFVYFVIESIRLLSLIWCCTPFLIAVRGTALAVIVDQHTPTDAGRRPCEGRRVGRGVLVIPKRPTLSEVARIA